MTDQEEREFLSSVSRRTPPAVIALIVIAVTLAALALLLLPLIGEADKWRDVGGKLGCADHSSDSIIINFDEPSVGVDERRTLTPAQMNSARQSVYVLMTFMRDDDIPRNSLGNGFVYDDGIVVTSEHLVREHRLGSIRVGCAGKSVPATVLRMNVALDVAVLSARGCHGKRLTLSTQTPEADERLIATGLQFWLPGQENDVPEDSRHLIPGLARHAAISTPYTHLRKTDEKAVLQISDVPVGPRIDPEVNGQNEQIRRNLAEITRLGLPRYQALIGLATRGQSGSLVLREDGSIVGIYSMRFITLNRTYYSPSSAIRLVLRGDGDD